MRLRQAQHTRHPRRITDHRNAQTAQSRLIWSLPLLHNAGQLYVLVPAVAGGMTSVLMPRVDIQRMLELIAEHRVTHGVGNGLALPFPDASFDLVWTQNSGMNIADKERLYAGFHRVLRPGGRLALQEPMAGPVEPVVYPVMWARDASTSFLRPPAAMRAVIERAGFRVLVWDDITELTAGPASAAAIPPHSIRRLVMGDAIDAITRAGHRNREEHRIVSIQAVCERA